MAMKDWLKNPLNPGRYSYEGKGSLLFDREKKMTTKIGKKQPIPGITPLAPAAKTIAGDMGGFVGTPGFVKKKAKVITSETEARRRGIGRALIAAKRG